MSATQGKGIGSMSLQYQDTAAEAAASAAKTVMYTGAGSAIFFGLRAEEFAAIVGAIVAVAGFLLTWYYKHQHLKLARARIEAQDED